MGHLTQFISQHMKIDVLYWLLFALGQGLFQLKRADLAAKSPLNGVGSKANYFRLNWVTICYRSAVEFGFPFYVVRHYGIRTLAGWIGWTVPAFIPEAPQNGVFFFFLGLASDGLMDWAAMQQKIAGIPVPSWLRENIPQLPQVQQLVTTLKANGGEK